MPAPILHKGLWWTVGHFVQTNTTRRGCIADNNYRISNDHPRIPQGEENAGWRNVDALPGRGFYFWFIKKCCKPLRMCSLPPASRLRRGGTFINDQGQDTARRHPRSASRSEENTVSPPRGLRSRISFTWGPGDTYYRNDP